MRPEFFTDKYGFIVDYLAEFFREMRKRSFADSIDKYFKLGNNLNQRDVIAVRKTVSGLVKLIFPHEEYTKEDIEEILAYALEGRRRVKEQLKKLVVWSSMILTSLILIKNQCKKSTYLFQNKAEEN